MMKKEIIFIFPILAAAISALTAAIGVTSVNAQNLTGNETRKYDRRKYDRRKYDRSNCVRSNKHDKFHGEWKYDWYVVEFDHADNTIPNTIVRKQYTSPSNSFFTSLCSVHT